MPMGKKVEANKRYTARQAAIILRVTEPTVTRHLRNGDFRGSQLGPHKKWHVMGSELLRVMKKWGYT